MTWIGVEPATWVEPATCRWEGKRSFGRSPCQLEAQALRWLPIAQALGRGSEGCPKAAEILAEQNRKCLSAAKDAAAAATKSGSTEGQSLERMDSPENAASGDSHCSDIYNPH